jgi:hypothetical protein
LADGIPPRDQRTGDARRHDALREGLHPQDGSRFWALFAAKLLELRAIGQLTGGIAHDFNNMLQAIISSLSMTLTRVQYGRTADVET